MTLPRKILLVFKKSARHNPEGQRSRDPLALGELVRYQQAGQAHRQALSKVRNALRARSLCFKEIYRAKGYDYGPFDLVISVGGDGTFLEAARQVRKQRILGVNSDPARSTGSFCRATVGTFERILDRFLSGKGKTERLNRLEVRFNGRRVGVPVLNDLLVAHRRPVVMSRYWLKIGSVREVQRSSGLWISTAAGSTGAIRSAGGHRMPIESKQIQYRPRELYAGVGFHYRLRGRVVSAKTFIRVGSLMQDALVSIDGDHVTLPFRLWDKLEVRSGGPPLHLIV